MKRSLCFLALGLLSACESTPLGASCGGEYVLVCGPYEYAEPSEASLEPSELPIADFTLTAHIRVALERCPAAPARHVVDLAVLAAAGGDGGALTVTPLLTLMEGTDGDPLGDDVIEVDVVNPLLATLPEESDVTLRFTARSTTPRGCASGAIEIPYRTGPRRML